jgi:2-methylcitrate dehydratase PrpD
MAGGRGASDEATPSEANVSETRPVASGGQQPTRQLAQFGSSLCFDDLPGEVVAKAKDCLLDTMGCCIFGASQPSVQKLAEMAAAEACAPRAAVFGTPMRTSAALAALLNGTSAHAFQLDEIHIESTLHPGSVAIPAAFALAEGDATLGGRDLLVAMVAGYEVGLRIGLAAKGGMFKSGFHNQGTTGVFIAAAAAARILRLDVHQTQHALGIAGSQAAGLMAVQDGAMTKSFHSGRAAQSGVYAAQLARLGYTGIPDVLEAPYGAFFSSFVDEWSEAELTADLVSRWEILRVGFKPLAASNGSITAMTALDTIMREHGLRVGDIERVTAFVSSNTLHHCGWPYKADRIQGVLSAQMNLRYGLAVMALERQAGVEQFAENKIRDPQILRFIECISVEHEPRFDGDNGRYRVACRLVVRCRNGMTFETTTLFRPGSPEDPLSREQLVNKFLSLTNRIGASKARRIASLVSQIEDCELSDLSCLLTHHEECA